MRFGKTRQKRYKDRFEALSAWRNNGIPKYAWFFTKLSDGTWVWLEEYRAFFVRGDISSLADRPLPLLWIRLVSRFERHASEDILVEKLRGR